MTRNALRALAVLALLGPALGSAGAVGTALAQHGAPAVVAGDLTLSAPWARATPPGAKAGGAFLQIVNAGKAADRLVSASSDVAGTVEIHEMAVTDGIMRMRALDKGLAIAAGETVTLKPGGLHVMLMELKKPLVAGETIKARLTFEKAGAVDVEFPVAPVGAGGPTGH